MARRPARPAARSRQRLNAALETPDPKRQRLISPSVLPSSTITSSTPGSDGQIGTPGNLNVSGFLTGEDYNPDLDGFMAYRTYDEMRRSDAQVRATLAMCKLPVKAATWDIKPASDDVQDIFIADQVRASLLGDGAMDLSWSRILDTALLKLDFGSSAHEIVWTVDETGLPAAGQMPVIITGSGRVKDIALHRERLSNLRLALAHGEPAPQVAQRFGVSVTDLAALTAVMPAVRFKTLAPRLPRTFYRWVEDPETGSLQALQQFAPKAGRYGFWNIPVDRLVLHVSQPEGNNWYGVSLLRAAYPHWFYKQQLYRIAGVSADREHQGIPIAKILETYQESKAPKIKIVETLKSLRSHHLAYVVQPFGVEYGWLTSQGANDRMTGLISLIEHHNVMIARNMLQSFSAQGEQRHGSFGAAAVSLDAFYDGLEGIVDEICAEIGQQAIQRLCAVNWPMIGRATPKLVCSDLGKMDAGKLATALGALAASGVITPDDTLEDWVRDIMNAPGLPGELRNQPRKKTAAGQLPPAPGDPAQGDPAPTPIEAARSVHEEGGVRFARQPTTFERKVFNLHAIPARLDSEKARLTRQLTDIRLKQLKGLAETLAKKDARKTSAFTDLRAKHLPAPQTDDIKRAIRAMQGRVSEYGASQVREELGRQGTSRSLAGPRVSRNKQTLTSALVSSAETTADRVAGQWQSLALENAQRLRRSGLIGDALAEALIEELTEEAEKWVTRAAGEEVNEAFGLGRAWQAEQLKDLIGGAVYSCVLDVNSCDPCTELDGQEFAIDSEDYEANMPPNANCEGKDSCRCAYLYVSKGE